MSGWEFDALSYIIGMFVGGLAVIVGVLLGLRNL